MSTLQPPATKFFPEDSLEKQVYNIVEKYKENIPIANDRNRLGFNLVKYKQGEGDSPEILVKSAKIQIEGITPQQLAQKLSDELKNI